MRFSRAALRTALCLMSLCLPLSVPAFGQDWGQPVWSDEFNGARGTPIDPAKWDYKIGNSRHRELASYSNFGRQRRC
jgi:hypothetical protein